MTTALPVLHQFLYSHFNEKARWGLDWKGVEHVRRCHLPGPHFRQMKRLSDQTATPVLELEGRVIAGSGRILDALEERYPDRPLMPEDADDRHRARELQSDFDRELGPAVRTALFSVLIDEPDHLCGMFSESRKGWARRLYRASFPLARRLMARGNGTTDPENVRRSFQVSEATLDRVARELSPGGQLVGDRFSVADLACCALLAPLAAPDHPDMTPLQPWPERMAEFHARWDRHPTIQWVREQYAKHRPRVEALHTLA